ncbi:MAG: c-type cytochrome [Gallionella sp.]|nr:c-type cytochrome [Gallionella sp.]
MQKYLLLFFTIFVLVSGCDNKEKRVASPTPALATAETPKAVEATTSSQSPKQPPQMAVMKLQPVTVSPSDPANLVMGEKVYKSTCSICHKSGLNGAPRMGSKKDWEQRLAQGNEVLYDRAINGYRGKKGSMPSRGSNPKLSEAEVKAAVDYIVAYSIPSWSVE